MVYSRIWVDLTLSLRINAGPNMVFLWRCSLLRIVFILVIFVLLHICINTFKTKRFPNKNGDWPICSISCCRKICCDSILLNTTAPAAKQNNRLMKWHSTRKRFVLVSSGNRQLLNLGPPPKINETAKWFEFYIRNAFLWQWFFGMICNWFPAIISH